MAVDTQGNLYASGSADGTPFAILKFASDGTSSVYAALSFFGPSSLAFAPNGLLYASSTTEGIVSISTNGTVTPFASGSFSSLAVDIQGNLYAGGVSGGSPFSVFRFTPEGTQSTYATPNSTPISLTFAQNGLLYASIMMEGISTISTNGEITPFATGGFTSLAFDSEGNLYAAGSAGGLPSEVTKFAPDGTPSNYTTLSFIPDSVAFVPEPSTYALLLLSGAASLWALKRRKS